MSTTTIIKCDSCAADLTEATGRPAYRLTLQSEIIPNNSGLSLMLKAHPIKEPHHFCGTGCLEMWLQAKHKGASTPPTPNA